MNKTPGWYDDEIAAHARLIINEGETQDQALVSLRLLVREAHREFGNAILDEFNAPRLVTAVAAAKSIRAAELREALRQAEAKTPPPEPASQPAVPKRETPAPPAAAPAGRTWPWTGLAGKKGSQSPAEQAPAPQSAPAVPQEHLPAAPAVPAPGAPVPPSPEVVAHGTQDETIAAIREELETLEPPEDAEWKLHQTLFPDFEFRSLKVTPTRYQKIHEMTAHDLDMARKILWNKTGHAIKGAESERQKFDAFYSKVRPKMQGDDTVADVERLLAAEARAAASRHSA